MLNLEKKIIEWINQHIVFIALIFVIISAAVMRLAGRNYMGNDYHFSLYDIPGNCHTLLYRTLAELLMKRPDTAVTLLKLLAYAGDFAVAILTLVLLHNKTQKIADLRTFFITTACLMSPVSLIYSVSGMKMDSVCMSLLLIGLLLYSRNFILPAISAVLLTAFLSTAYWPIAAMFLASMLAKHRKKGHFTVQSILALILTVICLVLSFALEKSADGNYFWGKIFIINPSTGQCYANVGQWIGGMCEIYGYFFATTVLILALKYRKMRIPALILQIIVTMYAGWQQTSYWAI